MDMKQLRYFVTIAEQGQVTRAARKLHMAQPPLSQQLKLLEEELGTLLFDRMGKKLELTSAGRLLYQKSVGLLQQMDETINEVQETGKGLRGVLSIGCVKSCFAYIPKRIRSFREIYPDITFELREGDSYRLAENLRNREIELAVVRLPLEMDQFACIDLPKEPFVAVIPGDWPVSSDVISMGELALMPLLLLHRITGVGQYEVVIDAFRSQGYAPNVICDCPDAAMLLSLVSSGVGATIVPKSTLLTMPTENVRVLEIEGSPILAEAAVIWLRDRFLSKSAVRFIDTFKVEMELNLHP